MLPYYFLASSADLAGLLRDRRAFMASVRACTDAFCAALGSTAFALAPFLAPEAEDLGEEAADLAPGAAALAPEAAAIGAPACEAAKDEAAKDEATRIARSLFM